MILSERSIKILQLTKNNTEAEIAKMMLVSKTRINQIKQASLAVLEMLYQQSKNDFLAFIKQHDLGHLCVDLCEGATLEESEPKKQTKLVARYRLVAAANVQMLTEIVQRFLSLDFQVFGAPFSHAGELYQCMYKDHAHEVEIDDAEFKMMSSEGRSQLAHFAALLFNPIELDFPSRIVTQLRYNNIIYYGDLVQRSEQELSYMPNIGPKTLKDIVDILASKGLKLNTKLIGWPPKELKHHLNGN